MTIVQVRASVGPRHGADAGPQRCGVWARHVDQALAVDYKPIWQGFVKARDVVVHLQADTRQAVDSWQKAQAVAEAYVGGHLSRREMRRMLS